MKLIKSIPTLTFLCAVAVLAIMTIAMFVAWVPYYFDSYRQQTERLEPNCAPASGSCSKIRWTGPLNTSITCDRKPKRGCRTRSSQSI